jgi:hypothetical protein
VYGLVVAGRIVCNDVSPFEAFSCPLTPSSPFYTLLEIERSALSVVYGYRTHSQSAAVATMAYQMAARRA